MGVSCLVSTGKQEVLDRFAFEIANIWLDVLGEIKEQAEREDDERCVLPDFLPFPLPFVQNCRADHLFIVA